MDANKAYEMTFEVMEGKAAPREIASGYVRYSLDEKGNGIDVSFDREAGVLSLRVSGPDARGLTVLPRYANSIALSLR